jgi:hypothetical protein
MYSGDSQWSVIEILHLVFWEGDALLRERAEACMRIRLYAAELNHRLVIPSW